MERHAVVDVIEADSNDDTNDEDSIDEDSKSSDIENGVEFIEESSESETEQECDYWDEDCVVIRNQRRKNAIDGYHLMPTCPLEHEVPPLKKQKIIETPVLNDDLTNKDFIKVFNDTWKNDKEICVKSVELFTNPFKFCFIDDFIFNKTILTKIREEFNDLQWNKRNMDMYEFFQSEDLMNLKSKYINFMYDFLKTDVKNLMQELTGYEIHKMSSTCSCYSDTDYLLIHDDLQEDRLIAFILYITDPVPGSDKELWTKEMGGLLELFSKDENGHPLESVKQIVPKNNRFVFFEVTNASYHQVSEVLNMDYCRLSINGWFHTPKPKLYKTPELNTPKTGLFSTERLSPLQIDIVLSNWINPQYIRDDIKKQIQHHVESESEISLNDFFNEDKFVELCEVLKNDDIIWEKVGPPNRRNYEVISTKITPSIVTEVLNLFQSKNMFNLLQEYTDLDLNIDFKPSKKPTVRLELQRWKTGNYSLFSEYDWESENELDVIMYLGNTENLKIVGGQTMYVSVNEKVEDALITLQPKANSLNMVFRDTARIVKYISKRSFHEYFYTIVCSYRE